MIGDGDIHIYIEEIKNVGKVSDGHLENATQTYPSLRFLVLLGVAGGRDDMVFLPIGQ